MYISFGVRSGEKCLFTIETLKRTAECHKGVHHINITQLETFWGNLEMFLFENKAGARR